ncbi:sperm acrosome membrane-associated protein 4-like [Echeneis naucrates]|uniref:Sperm acrosome membrane-associated protein 4-like n=1 Tax=Echeneis naucrates TaxID=173247 RepID=A0A665VLK6_ECHNA|nr:sperm acrosome membrane-associated protein 4-like [Echeneis naucrates]
MNRIILQLFAVGFCFAVGQALQCYKCKLGIWNLCITSITTCEEGEHCFNGVGHAVSFMNITMKGCLKVADCNQTKEVNFPTSTSNSTAYSMTKTCCTTNLCNAAPGLPGAAGVSLAFATVATLLAANILV